MNRKQARKAKNKKPPRPQMMSAQGRATERKPPESWRGNPEAAYQKAMKGLGGK